jgi:Cu+-exporting ATPase
MTGDRIERTAQFGFTKVHASVAPERKLALVQDLKQQGHRILFTGDGMNDAAAMSASDVSIAVGVEPGLPQQVASIVWPAPRFDRLARAIAICRETVRLVRWNLRFALAYNVIGIAIAAMGLLHPVIAVILMTISSCVVVLRSLRLLDENEPGVSTDSHETAP